MSIARRASRIALFGFLLVSAGCARSHLARHISPDETQGLRMHDENVKQPAVAALTDAEIQTLLQDNVGPDAQADGLVFGVVDEHGARVFSAGTMGDGTSRKVDGDTLFRIASITKVFTGILLQDMVDRGEMKLDDPVQQYLPPSVKMPTRGGKQITLFDLATHTSGLPRDGDGSDPEHLYAFLSNHRLQRDPGEQSEYSNLGVGLLGHVIALKAGTNYETLVIERICKPLGMDSTRIGLTPQLRARAARPNAFPGRPLADRDWRGPLEACGALRSTANDLLKFVSANAGITPSPLTPLLQRTWAVHTLPSGRSGRLVWMEDSGAICHGGQVNGFLADIAFDPAKRRGIVSLANCSNSRIRGVWKPILNRQSPKPARTATIDPNLLDCYVGVYQHANESACVVRRDGDRLLLQWWRGKLWHSLPQVRLEGFPQSKTVFSNQLWPDPVIFVCNDDDSHATHLLMRNVTWTLTATQPPSPTLTPIDPATFAGCTGRYRAALFGVIPVGPAFNVYLTHDELGSHLMGYAPTLPDPSRTELFPVTPSTVITPDLDGAWISFQRNKSGKATSALMHLNGDDIHGIRVSDTPEQPRR